jgi:hypothetical protein
MVTEYRPYIDRGEIARQSHGTALHDTRSAAITTGAAFYTAWRLLQLAALSSPEYGNAHKFRDLADEWQQATSHLSSVSQIVSHHAYQEIIGMGPVAIPLILHDLRARAGHWFLALRALTGAWPVPDDAAGDMARMRTSWLEWGFENGYLEPATHNRIFRV